MLVQTAYEMSPRTLVRSILIFFGIFVALYSVASFFPDSLLWGVNHLAWFSVTVRGLYILLAVVLAVLVSSTKSVTTLQKYLTALSSSSVNIIALAFAAGVIGYIICYSLRIVTDIYGDERTLLAWLSRKTYTFSDVFKFTGNDNEILTRLLYQQIAGMFHLDQRITYQLVSALCGGVFIGLYLYFVLTIHGSQIWKLFLIVMGLTFGSHQLFFGHVEDYTLLYLFVLVFLLLAWYQIEGKKTMTYMIIVYLVGIRLHIEMILVTPALLYIIAVHFKDRYSVLQKWLSPKRLLLSIGISMAGGLLLYLFYFKAYILLTQEHQERIDKIFLPIVNPLPGPHYYTLLSLNHWSDMTQEFLYIVSPAAILIGILAVMFRQRLSWTEPHIVFYTLAAFYFIVFDITANPLLTPARDWDLLASAAAPVLFLVITLSQRLFTYVDEHAQRWILGVSVGAAVLSCSIFVVNANSEAVNRRLIGIGKWGFKSYYAGSSYIINVGARNIADPSEQISIREKTIQDLVPYRSYPDVELGVLYSTLGMFAYSQKQFDKVEYNFDKAFKQDSTNADAIRGMALAALFTRRFDRASELLDFYNNHLNYPRVVDPKGLIASEYTNYFRYLQYAGEDSGFIQAKLDTVYNEFR